MKANVCGLRRPIDKDQIHYVAMDSKADDYSLFREIDSQWQVNLVTSCRKNILKSGHRKKLDRIMKRPRHRQIYKERAYRVEPKTRFGKRYI